jgi:hypothetical protein
MNENGNKEVKNSVSIFLKIISSISVSGLVLVGMAWGQVSRQVDINTTRLISLENKVATLERGYERIDERLIGMQKSNEEGHRRIEEAIAKLLNKP